MAEENQKEEKSPIENLSEDDIAEISEAILDAVKDDAMKHLEWLLSEIPTGRLLSSENWQISFDPVYPEGHTPLHAAARFKRPKMFEKLWPLMGLQFIRCEDAFAATPLHWAAAVDCVPIAEFILSQDSSLVELKNSLHGRTALHQAADIGSLELVKMLVERFGADLRARTNDDPDDGALPIHIAGFFGHITLLQYFIDKDPSLALEEDSQGNRPQHRAALGGGLFAVDFLLQPSIGGNVELAQRSHGRTCLHAAAQDGHLMLAKLLVEKHNANIRAKSNSEDGERYPCHLAARFGHLALVKYFVGLDEGLKHESDAEGSDLVKNAEWGLHRGYKGCKQVLEWLNSQA